MKDIVDKHVVAGGILSGATVVLSAYSVFMGAIAATATAGYMVLRGLIMWGKYQEWKKHLKNKRLNKEDQNQMPLDLK